MKTISRTAEKKRGKKWIETFKQTEPVEVYRDLMHDLINKKICCASYIKSIKRTNNYDGTQTIIVTYDNECRSIYIVENH